jgi:[acyl-carrier-protein] S-malonyltransferase
VRRGEESSLATFGEDIGMIMAVEAAQLESAEECCGFDYDRARMAFGYSLGEVSALVHGGVFALEHALAPLVSLADDCAALAPDVTMGIVFSRGAELDIDAVQRLCVEINLEDRGVIGVSAYLSPNSVLVLGQHETVDRFQARMHQTMPGPVHLRKNQERWPPLHTPIMWDRNIPNRAARQMLAMPGGLTAPVVEVFSLVTGRASYKDYNSREILAAWIDHPQRLWDAVAYVLSEAVETVIHVGPAPNLIPATFKRLSDNVRSQLGGGTWNSLGRRAISGIVSRPWLARWLSARAQLLRAPHVRHIVLEDWLLDRVGT